MYRFLAVVYILLLFLPSADQSGPNVTRRPAIRPKKNTVHSLHLPVRSAPFHLQLEGNLIQCLNESLRGHQI